METIQRERQETLREACHKYAQQNFMKLEDFASNKSNYASLIYNDEHKVIYNFVHKVASQHLVKLFNKNTNYDKNRLYDLKYGGVMKRLREYKKIIFVRDPFTRFVSVYRNKFIEHPNKFYKQFAALIIKLYRRKDISNKEILKFSEFLQFVTGYDDSRRRNTHWSSYVRRNKVCLLEHDFIGKLETMEDDLNYLSKQILGLEGKSIIEGPRHNTTTGQTNLLHSMYSQVPKKTLQKLVKFYESDFKIFEYNSTIPS